MLPSGIRGVFIWLLRQRSVLVMLVLLVLDSSQLGVVTHSDTKGAVAQVLRQRKRQGRKITYLDRPEKALSS